MLDFLLDVDLPGVQALREQARVVTVRRRCACGCPTIELAVDRVRGRAAATGGATLFSKARVPGPVEDPYHVYLYVTDGWLTELELVALSSAVRAAFPSPSELEPAVGAAVSFGPEAG